MGLRSAVATGVGRVSAWGQRSLLHRSGSQLPGRIALTLDPWLLGELGARLKKCAIVVCGTNCKTTTT